MASLHLFLSSSPATNSTVTIPRRRLPTRPSATAVKATGGSGGGEKSFLDFILGGLVKEEQEIYETDPILKKVEEKDGTGTASARKNTASAATAPAKKKDGGGFGLGGLFAKK